MSRWLTAKDILNIPEEGLPLLVLSDNIRSFLSWGIKAHQKGAYNHLMWMHKPGLVASQDLTFKESKIENYLKGSHRLKFWGLDFNDGSKHFIRNLIHKDLSRPWYKRLYDPLQIIGKLIHIDSLQTPGLDICSDKAKYLRHVDKKYNAEVRRHRSPTEINKYFQTREDGYFVYGRFALD